MQVYNNLNKKLEAFSPANGETITMYSCGPTVYDVSHVGHARSCIVWDMVYRFLKFHFQDHKLEGQQEYKTIWIRNITNVDDKIVNRARDLDISPDKLSRIYTHEFWSDMDALNVSWPDFEPRATDYIREMIKFIEDLIEKGFAYESKGDVYFRVDKHKDYGQLKGLSLEELEKGEARVEANTKKEKQLDFALWKAFPNEDYSFDSPWGKGRPGWHLECSTMIKSILEELGLGSTLDIHSGGDDLVFPHHENECAQSECLTDSKLANYWMHNGMVMINGKKMSKSENNFMTIKDLLKKYNANTIRYFALSTHYKKQINFSDEALTAAQTGLNKLLEAIDKNEKEKDMHEGLINTFRNAMKQDFNTAQALALLFDNKDKPLTVSYLLQVLGFDLSQKSSQSSTHNGEVLDNVMQLVLDIRAKARENKDFATSDLVRDSLTNIGITIKDHKDSRSDWEIG
jgi:cysteinyl-tRNA synthetase